METVFDVITSRRSIRKFKQMPLPEKLLARCVEAARFAPSAANLQPCEYIIVTDAHVMSDLFACLSWARYLHPTGTPSIEERPVAYIAVLLKSTKNIRTCSSDAGAGIQNMLLTAWAQGVGTCWIRSINTRKAKKIMHIPHNVYLDSVIAFGYPAEKSIAEEMGESVKYYRDKDNVIHVPKRQLANILFHDHYGQSHKQDQVVI